MTPQRKTHLMKLLQHDIQVLERSTYIESERTQRERVALGRSLPQLKAQLQELQNDNPAV